MHVFWTMLSICSSSSLIVKPCGLKLLLILCKLKCWLHYAFPWPLLICREHQSWTFNGRRRTCIMLFLNGKHFLFQKVYRWRWGPCRKEWIKRANSLRKNIYTCKGLFPTISYFWTTTFHVLMWGTLGLQNKTKLLWKKSRLCVEIWAVQLKPI